MVHRPLMVHRPAIAILIIDRRTVQGNWHCRIAPKQWQQDIQIILMVGKHPLVTLINL